MELRPGYKQTEVGVIPEDWAARALSQVCSMKSGLGITSSSITEAGEYPCYGGNGLRGYTCTFTHEGAYTLVGRQGALCGNIVAVSGQFFASEHAIVVTPRPATDIGFLGHVLRCMNLNQYSESSAQPGLSVQKLLLLPVGVPPIKAEQEAIAEALSDADALIASLEQLIAKKRLIKQGVMQELLTGKRRLPGFEGEWNLKTWGEVIVSCSSGATPYRGRPEFYKGTIKWITSGELNYCIIYETIEHISKEAVAKTNLKIHPAGTFLMAITGLEAAGTRGSCGIVGRPATTNQSCMAVYPNSHLRTDYLYHYYVFAGDQLAFNYCQGTKQQSYTAKIIRKLPILIPPTVMEQEAIAEALSDMDAEIEAEEQRLLKTRQLKQGMMQQLLTGRIRLL
jgi:type I restriction enzyme S subunit